VSAEELSAEGRIDSDELDDLVAAMRDLSAAGAVQVVVTRAAEPALALVDDALVLVRPPRLTAEDHRGAGDSLTAGIAATLADGGNLLDGLRMGAAAGALNVTRRGLATGRRAEIERLASRVEVEHLETSKPAST
jgi:1-phosphofructokinase